MVREKGLALSLVVRLGKMTYRCDRCLINKSDTFKMRAGKRMCQKCTRQFDKRLKSDMEIAKEKNDVH